MDIDIEITETEDIRGWESAPVPVPQEVHLSAGHGLWVVERPDGTRQVWRLEWPGKGCP